MLPPRHPAPRRHLRLAAAALLLALAAVACSGADSDSADDAGSTASSVDEVAQATAAPAPDGDIGFADEGEAAAEDAEAPAPEEGAADTSLPVEVTAATGERIIKEGTVSIEVEPGDYDTAFGQVIARAQALGGHVSGTSSSTTPAPPDDPDGQALVSGQVTIRVPVRAFEDLLTSIGEAGEITDRAITSQDVTAEFTDLESRRRNLQAQERFYLGLLERAATVQDAIAVQQQLDGIQGQIEQITGRLNLLGDRSAFSTLTVRIAERGAEPVTAIETEPGGLTPYIEDAGDTLIATVGSLIVILTFLTPLVLLAAIAYGIWRVVRRRDAATPAAPVPPGSPAAAPAVPVGVGGRADAPDPADGADR